MDHNFEIVIFIVKICRKKSTIKITETNIVISLLKQTGKPKQWAKKLCRVGDNVVLALACWHNRAILHLLASLFMVKSPPTPEKKFSLIKCSTSFTSWSLTVCCLLLTVSGGSSYILYRLYNHPFVVRTARSPYHTVKHDYCNTTPCIRLVFFTLWSIMWFRRTNWQPCLLIDKSLTCLGQTVCVQQIQILQRDVIRLHTHT